MSNILSKATVKSYLQISHTDEDDLIDIGIAAWEEWLSTELGIYFYETSGAVEEYLDGGNRSLRPSYLPINSVTKVEDSEYDDDEYDSDDYNTSDRRIELEEKTTRWGEGVKRWKTTYNAGYLKSNPPAGMRVILLDLIYKWYWGRGGSDPRSSGFAYNWKNESNVKGSIGSRMKIYQMNLWVS